MNKYRVFKVDTGETIMFLNADSIMDASYIVGKWYGTDNDEVDVEEA